MATIADLLKQGKTTRRSFTATASATSSTANTTPVLKANPRRVSWVIAQSSANAGRVFRRSGLGSTSAGIPLAANDGLVGEDFETAGLAVQDPVFVIMSTADATVYVE